ncbi:hypothetical protein N7495_002119 [Penicillium taxi]|uniref:uncharacterized protein n=1 Tax=Penicillium taxi TaxID=168475 RepID=UPI002545ACC0|nr:uncharacterized protein N7495_002119 [Penicillium taxi]KAJ5901591.1 hypothetical protein N7495_002119 [Penicillium taxi]
MDNPASYDHLYRRGAPWYLTRQLAEFHHLHREGHPFNIHEAEVNRTMMTYLLKKDFRLDVTFAEDRLTPAIPNRLRYILWIHKLLDSTTKNISHAYDPSRQVFGIDVGTGHCAIYSIMGCRVRPRWKFLGTDIDAQNISTARETVKANNLEDRITIMETSASESFFPMEKFPEHKYDFTMCNPPFYASIDEMKKLLEEVDMDHESACTGSHVEMITPGGELEFIKRMIDDSRAVGDRIQWFTTMIGQMRSVRPIIKYLQDKGMTNYAISCLQPHAEIKRPVIAWSWQDKRPPSDFARDLPNVEGKLQPPLSQFHLRLVPTAHTDDVIEFLNKELTSIAWFWEWDENLGVGVGYAETNAWGRVARRKAALSLSRTTSLTEIPKEVKFGVRISVKEILVKKKGDTQNQDLAKRDSIEADDNDVNSTIVNPSGLSGLETPTASPNPSIDSSPDCYVQVTIQWNQGYEKHMDLFDSFLGMIRGRLDKTFGLC